MLVITGFGESALAVPDRRRRRLGGGPEAFTRLFQHPPDDTGMAFGLIQHLDPRHESELAALLAKATATPVAVEPDSVYAIPPNASMTIAEAKLRLALRGESRGPRLPVDALLKSLADDQRSAAIGVILSGAGYDDTLALAEVKPPGGVTFARDRESAGYDGMPQAAPWSRRAGPARGTSSPCGRRSPSRRRSRSGRRRPARRRPARPVAS